ncbi:MAG: OmpH family outer membrane protein [Myxococcota bacterium]|nr:OmpH family outer membrane protein [Myxococcota bacterium]
MSFNKTIVVVIAFLALGWGLGAEKDGGTKIGIVDLDQAVGSTDEGKAAREELERKQREAELEIQPMIERYQTLAEEYQKKRPVLSPEKLRAMELDLTELQSQLELKQEEFQNRMKVDFERLIGPMREKLQKVVTDVGREEGFSLIVVRSMPGVMYARESLDITDLVVKKFNAES